ncbi:acyltransferase family protein [Paludisphaera rhizosphaerae]|uniref:acyltransferase family protein n=1 Tax=Paludisphaera rhizosphaerae TaxID=2711216 RepID=UPI0013EB8EA6|nr:acyltransferase family protein [Paludisphaera rhizosphaerae]
MRSSNQLTARSSAAMLVGRRDASSDRTRTSAVVFDAGIQGRVAGFDVLRLVALTAIVAFHAGAPGADYTAWRLPTLAIISASLAAGRDPRSFSGQVRKSASRLLAPWAFWCGVYGVIDLSLQLRLGVSIVDDLGARVLLTGTSVHLWYLPFAFTMMLFINVSRRLTTRMNPGLFSGMAVALALLALAALAVHKPYQGDAGTPGPQWLRCLPAVFLGLGMGTAMRQETLGRPALVGLALATAAACGAIAAGLHDELALRYGLAALLVAAAASWRFDPPQWLTATVGMGMGVYLVHMAVHRVVYALANRLPTPDLTPAGQGLVVIVLSFALVAALSRTRLKRFV